MPTLKLTKSAIQRLRAPHPTGKQVAYWDTELKGFGVLLSGVKATKTFIVQRDLPGGKTRRMTIGQSPALELAEATKRAKEYLGDYFYKGIDPKTKPKTGTLREVLDEYLDPDRPGKKPGPTSRKLYRKDVEQYLTAWLDLPLSALTRDMIEDRHAAIAKEIAAGRTYEPTRPGQKPIVIAPGRFTGHAQANRSMVVLRALWSWAARRDEALPMNPVSARLRDSWHRVDRRETYVKASLLPTFYSAVIALPNRVARDYLLLVLFTGLRRNEAAGLKWDYVDFEERVIRLPASVTKAKRKLDLPMTTFVYDLLSARRELGMDKFVFPAAGKSRHIAEPKFFLKQVAAASGVEVSVHDLRRTFATVAASAGISTFALRAMLNHSLGRDVTSGYVQLTADELREPAERVAEKMLALCKPSTKRQKTKDFSAKR